MCGFIAALDIIKTSDWIKEINLQEDIFSETVKVLANKPESNYYLAAKEIYNFGKDQSAEIQELGMMQDPWTIVNTIQIMMIEGSKAGEHSNLLPLQECECGLIDRMRISRNP